MKKTAAIFLLILLVAPAAVTFLWLKMEKKSVKKAVKHRIIAGIEDDELVLLKFTDAACAQLDWKHSKEFAHQGQMYDIVKREKRGDTNFFWCWWDAEETQLNKQLNQLLASVWHKNPDQKQRRSQLISFYKSLFFSASAMHNTLVGVEKGKPFAPRSIALLWQNQRPPSPPPRILM